MSRFEKVFVAVLALAAIGLTLAITARSAEAKCRTAACHDRVYMKRTIRPYHPWLRSLRWCESTNQNINSANGMYRGYYQFDRQTWRSVNGVGDPQAHSLLEQSYRAVLLRKRRGTSPWPNCG